MADLSIQAVITAQDQASKVLKGFQSSLESAEKGSKAFAGALLAVGAAAVGFGIASVKAYADAQASQTRFEHALRQVTGATDEQIASLRKQQLALQQTTRFEDDSIASAQGFLATFQLSAQQVEFMTPRLLDMAEGLRDSTGATMGLEQASNMLGKAIQLGTVGMLAKAGVTIPGATSAMQDLWKKNFELADIQERVKMVGDLVDGNFKGQAVSAGKTLYGAIDKLKNNFGNFMEVIGEALSRYLGPLVSKLAEWFGQFTDLDSIMKTLNPTLKFLGDNLGWIAGAIIGALVPAFYALGVSIWTALAPLLPFIAAGAALGLIAKLIIDNWGQITQFLSPLLPLWTFLKDIFLALWTTLKDQLLPIWDQLKTALEPLMPLLKMIAVVIGVLVLGSILSIIAGLVLFIGLLTGVISAVSTFVTGIVQYFSGVVQYFTGFWMVIRGLFTGNWQMVIDGFNKMKDGVISIFTGLYNMTIGTVYKLVDGIVNYFFNLYQRLIGHSIIPDIVNGIIAWFGKLPGMISKGLANLYDYITSPFKSAFNWISGQVSALSSKLSSLAAKASSTLGLKARALGGPVMAGQSYMVGENGPEMFVPYNSGKIIPNGKIGGSSSITVNFYGDIKNTDDKSLDEIGNRVARQMELARFGVL